MLNQPKPLRRRLKEKGMATMMTAFSLIMLIPMAGLAVDGGLAYIVKTRLSAAADSSALAAARGLNGGSSISAAQTQATTLATTFFNGNFPAGYLNTDSTAANRTISATFTLGTGTGSGGNGVANGVLQVQVTAKVNSATFFMKYLGYPSLPISSTGTATRRQLVLTLVLDQSSSMGVRNTTVGTIPTSITSTSNSCEAMVYNAIQFLGYFSPYDYIGVVPFDLTAYTTYPPTTSYGSANGAAQQIANIQCGSNTNTTAALQVAYNQIQAINLPLANNVIVLFTDGVPNAVNASFPVRSQTDTRFASVCSSGTVACSFSPCATRTGTVTGSVAQWSGFSYTPAFSFSGLSKSIDSDSSPSWPSGSSTCAGLNATDQVQQGIAYFPATDSYSNSTSGPYDNWLYLVNPHTAPVGTPITPQGSATKMLGDLWSNYSSTGAGAPSNKFTSGPYSGFFRPDLPNTLGAVSMNTAVNEANKIRNNSTYRITIHTIYLQGNGGDPVDRAFLQIVSNQPQISPIIYDNTATAYTNTYYNSAQQTGLWLPTTSTAGLTSLFNQVASSLLRISQ